MDYKKIKSEIKKFTQKMNFNYFIVLFLIGLILIITASFFKGGNNDSAQNTTKNTEAINTSTVSENENLTQEEKQLQDKLKNTLEQMDGVGKTNVMIYFESGKEDVPAVNTNDSVSNTEEKDTQGGTRNTTQNNNGETVVTTNENNSTKPFIVKTIKPKITGVIIVAEGADNKKIQLEITEAVVDLFNISYDKVNVYPMKK